MWLRMLQNAALALALLGASGSGGATASVQFEAPVLISEGVASSGSQMAHGCDRFTNLDAAGTVIFGGGQLHMYYSTDGARSFQPGYAEDKTHPYAFVAAGRTGLHAAGPLSRRDFGSIYTATKTNTTAFNFSTSTYVNYSLVDGNITAAETPVPAAKRYGFYGLPHGNRCDEFACSLRLQGTGHVTLPDGSELQTAIVWWGGNDAFPLATSIVVFRSVDGGWEWNYRATVANASQYLSSQEGPNEHDMSMLADGSSVMILMRLDGGDGPTHPFKSYARSVSTDSGLTWSRAESLPALGCARPRLHMMGPRGPLLASGGRGKPGVSESTPGYPNDVTRWVSVDGMP